MPAAEPDRGNRRQADVNQLWRPMIPVPLRLDCAETKLIGQRRTEDGMAKYRMDIFKPGRKPQHPAPMLWRRRDIYASNDAAAKAAAEDLYRIDASQRLLTSFYLCNSGGRTIYQSPRGNY
jgi:hypothetical protein